jgi:hypothetical protein
VKIPSERSSLSMIQLRKFSADEAILRSQEEHK